MLETKRTDRVTSDKVFNRAQEGKSPLKILKNRHHSWIGHTVKRNKFVVNSLEGAISGKQAVGRPRLQYSKRVARNTQLTVIQQWIEWLATVADGKLPTNQKIEG
jgi:hypothetical protein